MSRLEAYEPPAQYRFVPLQAELERARPADRAPMIRALHQTGSFTAQQRAAAAHHRKVALEQLSTEEKRSSQLVADLALARAELRAKQLAAPSSHPFRKPPVSAGINPIFPPEDERLATARSGGRAADTRAPPEVTYYRGLIAEKRIALERAFQSLDVGCTGFLPPAELLRSLQLYDVKLPSPATFNNLIGSIDRNAAGHVSWPHFLRSMCAALDPKETVDSSVQVRAGQLRDRLRAYDVERSGVLSASEMVRALREDGASDATGLAMYLDREEAKRVVETARMRASARQAAGERGSAHGSRPVTAGGIAIEQFVDDVHHSRSLPWFLLPKTHRSVSDLMIREEVSGALSGFGDNKSHDELHRRAAFVMKDGHLVERRGRVPGAVAHRESEGVWPGAASSSGLPRLATRK